MKSGGSPALAWRSQSGWENGSESLDRLNRSGETSHRRGSSASRRKRRLHVASSASQSAAESVVSEHTPARSPSSTVGAGGGSGRGGSHGLNHGFPSSSSLGARSIPETYDKQSELRDEDRRKFLLHLRQQRKDPSAHELHGEAPAVAAETHRATVLERQRTLPPQQQVAAGPVVKRPGERFLGTEQSAARSYELAVAAQEVAVPHRSRVPHQAVPASAPSPRPHGFLSAIATRQVDPYGLSVPAASPSYRPHSYDPLAAPVVPTSHSPFTFHEHNPHDFDGFRESPEKVLQREAMDTHTGRQAPTAAIGVNRLRDTTFAAERVDNAATPSKRIETYSGASPAAATTVELATSAALGQQNPNAVTEAVVTATDPVAALSRFDSQAAGGGPLLDSLLQDGDAGRRALEEMLRLGDDDDEGQPVAHAGDTDATVTGKSNAELTDMHAQPQLDEHAAPIVPPVNLSPQPIAIPSAPGQQQDNALLLGLLERQNQIIAQQEIRQAEMHAAMMTLMEKMSDASGLSPRTGNNSQSPRRGPSQQQARGDPAAIYNGGGMNGHRMPYNAIMDDPGSPITPNKVWEYMEGLRRPSTLNDGGPYDDSDDDPMVVDHGYRPEQHQRGHGNGEDPQRITTIHGHGNGDKEEDDEVSSVNTADFPMLQHPQLANEDSNGGLALMSAASMVIRDVWGESGRNGNSNGLHTSQKLVAREEKRVSHTEGDVTEQAAGRPAAALSDEAAVNVFRSQGLLTREPLEPISFASDQTESQGNTDGAVPLSTEPSGAISAQKSPKSNAAIDHNAGIQQQAQPPEEGHDAAAAPFRVSLVMDVLATRDTDINASAVAAPVQAIAAVDGDFRCNHCGFFGPGLAAQLKFCPSCGASP